MRTIFTAAAAALMASSAAGAAEFMWTFAGGDLAPAAQAGGTATMTYFTPATQSLTRFGNTASDPAVPDAADGPTDYMFVDTLADGGVGGFGLDWTGVQANGGGAFVNSYTFIADVYIPTLNWTALFNTNEAHANDADWYVDPTGRLGIGALGYAPAGSVAAAAWQRLAFVRDMDGGATRYFVNGVEVAMAGAGSVDGRFSIYTEAQPGLDLLVLGEGDGSGNYTNPIYLSSLFFADRALAPEVVRAMGGVSGRGIIVPEPSSLAAAALASLCLARRRR